MCKKFQKKISEVFIICPGFTVDCLETLEEINTENREIFLKNGGKKYTYIPCLNDSTYQLKLFQFLVDKHTQNWVKQEEQTRNPPFFKKISLFSVLISSKVSKQSTVKPGHIIKTSLIFFCGNFCKVLSV